MKQPERVFIPERFIFPSYDPSTVALLLDYVIHCSFFLSLSFILIVLYVSFYKEKNSTPCVDNSVSIFSDHVFILLAITKKISTNFERSMGHTHRPPTKNHLDIWPSIFCYPCSPSLSLIMFSWRSMVGYLFYIVGRDSNHTQVFELSSLTCYVLNSHLTSFIER